jgi:hypothetical protein
MPSEDAFILRVSLEGIRPPIWRRLHVRRRSTLHQLHAATQIAMGWTNRDARRITLARAAAKSGGRFTYLYDFGDDRLQTVVIETTEPEPDEIYPYRLAGERACPPEDSGWRPWLRHARGGAYQSSAPGAQGHACVDW